MTRFTLAGVALLGVLASVVNHAWGAEPVVPEADDAADEAAATELVKLAAKQYDQGRFDDALRTLEGARAISARPAILYNIGQVQRARKDCAGALAAYRIFLAATPSSDPNHERALRWQAEMQLCADEEATSKRAAVARSPAGTAAVVAPVIVPSAVRAPVVQGSLLTESSERPSQGIRASAPASSSITTRHRSAITIAGWSLIGAGAIAGITALALQWKASSIQGDLEKTGYTSTDPRLGTGRSYAHGALWTGIGGGVLAVGGGAILLISRQPASASTPMALLGWHGSF